MHPPGARPGRQRCFGQGGGDIPDQSHRSGHPLFAKCTKAHLKTANLANCLVWGRHEGQLHNFTQLGHVLYLAVSAFLAPTYDQRVYRSTQSVLMIDLIITHFTRNPQPVLELRCS